MVPGVETPDLPDEDGAYDAFADFVVAHPRPIVVGMIVVALMIFWKKPMFRGILAGLLIAVIIFFIANA